MARCCFLISVALSFFALTACAARDRGRGLNIRLDRIHNVHMEDHKFIFDIEATTLGEFNEPEPAFSLFLWSPDRRYLGRIKSGAGSFRQRWVELSDLQKSRMHHWRASVSVRSQNTILREYISDGNLQLVLIVGIEDRYGNSSFGKISLPCAKN